MKRYLIRHCKPWLPSTMEYLEVNEDCSMGAHYRWVMVYENRNHCKVGTIGPFGLEPPLESQIVGQVSKNQFEALYCMYRRS